MKNKKKFPIWLKGGIIGLISFITIGLIDFILSRFFDSDMGQGIIFIFTAYPALWFYDTFVLKIVHPAQISPALYIFSITYMAIYYFLLGALIGWLIGIIKEESLKGK